MSNSIIIIPSRLAATRLPQKPLIKINNNYVYAYYGLFSLSEKLLNDKDFNHLEKVLKNRKTNLIDKSIINFLLSKKERKNKNIFRFLNLS